MGDPAFILHDQLDQLEDLVLEGNRIPFTGGRLVNENEAIELLDQIRESLPSQVAKAGDLVKNIEQLLNRSQNQADEIVCQAELKREQLLNSATIRKEAERQVSELLDNTRHQCEKLLQTTRTQAGQMEQDSQTKLISLEQDYSTKRQILEQELIEARQKMEQEIIDRKRHLAEQHELNCQQALKEVDLIKKDALRLRQDTHQEVERIHSDALNYRTKMQAQCEALIQHSRSEATALQDGANQYAEQTLRDLEEKLFHLTHIVQSGRNELSKIQAITSTQSSSTKEMNSHKTIQINRETNHNSKPNPFRNIG
ncbi:hypothetical protein [Prochlorococcus sp. MIT 1300]|uniref:hypothetical protein n=1 Tax=Prochlorococcus sp. MIT 1300 TaxID=3096218 RepID=UPI002A760F36|nr:hypothetical protein [Prochlorococcus sp. MIT 1300]